MLVGTYKYSVDSKNRVCIPPKFRNDFGGRCMISKDIADDCINLHSMERWTAYTGEIEKLPSIEMSELKKSVYAYADEVEIDSQGRIILNQKICEKVGLAGEKEIIIIGHLTHAQIWNVEAWEKYEKNLNSKETKESIKTKLKELKF